MDGKTKTLNSKRIAKNTIFLYLRMLLIMAISLFTSRIVLDTLGVVDFGLNNVVGGVITMFAFFNTAMVTASQRYITIGLAENNLERLKVIFTTSFQIHIIISFVIIILGETVGLWFVYNKLVIPTDRMYACLWVYHLSIVTIVANILSVPYNSAIIAHEKMGAFASISIVEIFFKLGIVYLLYVSPIDRLILFAILGAIVQITMRNIYIIYCKRHFKEIKLIRVCDRVLIKEMGAFASWNLLGNLAVSLCGQGLNILINMFFGPAVNAARGIAVQVDSTIDRFSGSFTMAVNPQLTKLYAENNKTDMTTLLYRSSKLAFFLILALSLPVIMETELILYVWLKQIPEYSVSFVRVLLLIAILNTLVRPSVTLISATGIIKQYQLVVGGILLMVVPISYLVLKMGGTPFSVYVVHLAVNIVIFIIRFYYMKKLVGLSIKEYVRNVLLRCICVILLSVGLSYVYMCVMTLSTGAIFVNYVIIFIIVLLSSYIFGITNTEKEYVFNRIQTVLVGKLGINKKV